MENRNNYFHIVANWSKGEWRVRFLDRTHECDNRIISIADLRTLHRADAIEAIARWQTFEVLSRLALAPGRIYVRVEMTDDGVIWFDSTFDVDPMSGRKEVAVLDMAMADVEAGE
jgi:hypothetical protein